jgi:thymidine kinase
MFSGKTEEFIRRLKRVSRAGQKALVIRPDIDCQRYSKIQTHDGSQELTTATGFEPVVLSRDLHELDFENLNSMFFMYDVIGIEEAQFFGPNIRKVVKAALKVKKRVICTGLDTDCLDETFGDVPWLLAHAHIITKLTSICAVCGEEANKTQSKKPMSLDKVSEAVGGESMYEPRCDNCFDPIIS